MTIKDASDSLRMKRSIFSYNYSWPNWVWLFDSWLAKAALGVPVIGYMILFNDTVAKHFSFSILAGDETWSLIPSGRRLQLIYFGLIMLGVANFLYFMRRPYVMRLGKSSAEYVRNMLERATISDFIELNGQIRHSDSDPYTNHGKYYDSEWEAFYTAAMGRPIEGDKGRDVESAHWADAKNKFESMLRSILLETYFRESTKRRLSLSICVALGSIGLFLLLVPSLDLFVRVLGVIVKHS